MKRKGTSVFLIAMMLFGMVMSAFAQAKPIELKIGHFAPPNTPYDDWAKEFKKEVEAASNGKYKITIYPSGLLGQSAALLEGLQAGIIQFAIVTTSDMTQFVPEFEVVDLPYVFRDWPHALKYLDSDAAKKLFALSDKIGIKSLSSMPRGFRHVTSNKGPIRTPADLKGLKIRVAESAVYVDTFKALGANAQAMPWSEVYTALQQGTVDAHENNIVTVQVYHFEEVQKYMSETGHFFAFGTLAASLDWFKSLPRADQDMFQKAATDSAKLLGIEQRNQEAAAKADLISKGMIFNAVDTKPFEALMTPVYDKYFKTHNRVYFDELKAFK